MRRTWGAALAWLLVSIAAMASQAVAAQAVARPELKAQGAVRPTGAASPGALLPGRPRIVLQTSGPLSLRFIDPGYAEAQPDGSRVLTFAACAEDAQGYQGTVAGMTYTLKLKNETKSGDMQRFLTPPFKPGQTKAIGNVDGCRQARINFPPCAVEPGTYEVTVLANMAGGGSAPPQVAHPVIGPDRTSIALQAPAGAITVTPATVQGIAASQCHRLPKDVRLFADKGADVVIAPVGGDGRFSAPFTFRHAGLVRLHALVVGDDRVDGADATADVKVAPAQATATILTLPQTARIGTAEPVTAVLRDRATKAVLAGVAVSFRLDNAQACSAETAANGEVHCSLAVAANAAAIGYTPTLSVTATDVSVVETLGPKKVLLTSMQGLIVHQVPAAFLQPQLAAAQPYGILIDAFNRHWTGTGAHADNASRLYPSPDLGAATPFDVPSLHVSKNIVFYPDHILVRLKPFRFAAPATMTADFFITGADGHGPRIKGFCFTAVVCSVPGYDDAMPDINAIAVLDGRLTLTFAVVNGKVRPSLSAFHGNLDFTCGGIAAVACTFLRSTVNAKLNSQLASPPMVEAMLQRIGSTMDATFAKMLPGWNMKSLAGLTWDGDGNLIVTGTPLAS